MTTPATAYAPGSPAGASGGGDSIAGSLVKGIASKVFSGLGVGGGPGIGVGSTSSSASGDAAQGGSGTGSDFAVNFGNGVSQGGGLPSWVWIAAIAAGAIFVLRSRA